MSGFQLSDDLSSEKKGVTVYSCSFLKYVLYEEPRRTYLCAVSTTHRNCGIHFIRIE